jgi:hypothetical protein
MKVGLQDVDKSPVRDAFFNPHYETIQVEQFTIAGGEGKYFISRCRSKFHRAHSEGATLHRSVGKG